MASVFRPLWRLAVSVLVGVAFLAGAASLAGDAVGSDTADAGVHDGEPRLRRLTEAQYRATIADVFGSDIKITGRFEPDLRVGGLLATGTSKVSITPGGAEQYEATARGIAEQVVDPAHRDRLVGCAPGPADPDGRACADRFFTRIGLRLFRRPLLAEERRLAVASALAASRQSGDFHAGLAASLAGMLADLPFLFQVDAYVADPGSPGRRTLDGWSRATKLSYFLWNSTPDEELLRAAASGELMTEAGIARQVDRLIGAPRFFNGARAFLDDFLQLEGMTTLAKDGLIYPAFRSAVAVAAREQTLRTALQLLIAERADYRDLFTTRRVAMNRVLSPIYRIPFAAKDWSFVELPEGDPRAGLLTQVSFLAMHAHEGRTSPTLRGKAIREIVMCRETPTPPANVNFTIVQDTSNPKFKTTRERLQAHLDDEECASCHRLTDPMGLALEKFDGAGQFREKENDAAIDVSGTLDRIAFQGADGLGRALHDNPAVPQCFVQSAWRYGSGIASVDHGGPVVAALSQGFANDGYRVPNLFRAIALNPSFYSDGGALPGSGKPGAAHARRSK